jgi:transcriptional regulator, AraC family
MKESSADQLKYLSINSQDEDWGIVVTTVGYQFIPPEGSILNQPIRSRTISNLRPAEY